jgi:hypothetical protein
MPKNSLDSPLFLNHHLSTIFFYSTLYDDILGTESWSKDGCLVSVRPETENTGGLRRHAGLQNLRDVLLLF